MSKRSFLKPLSAVLAALASAATWGATKDLPPSAPPVSDKERTAPADASQMPIAPNESRSLLFKDPSGDIFNFVLKRSADGIFMAQHRSHVSHNSHSSHNSHDSHSSHSSHYSSSR